VRLAEFLTTEDWTIEDLADAVTRDSNLAAGVLRRANSALFGRGKELTSPREACTRLGSKAVVALAFELIIGAQFKAPQEPYRTVLKNAWRNAIVASRVAPPLGRVLMSSDTADSSMVRRPRLNQEVGRMLLSPDAADLSLLALFHNLGELLCVCLLAELARLPSLAVTPEQLAVEVEALHEILGAALATSWKLPSSVIRLVGHHHRPAQQPEPKEQELLRNLILASWSMALKAGFTYLPGHESVSTGDFLEVLGLDEQRVKHVYERVRTWPVDT